MQRRGIVPARRAAAIAMVAALGISLTACQEDKGSAGSGDDQVAESSGDSAEQEAAPPARLETNVRSGDKKVEVDTPVAVSVSDGTLDKVTVTTKSDQPKVKGEFSADNTAWTASDLLEPGTAYVVKARGTNADGVKATTTSKFTTRDLTLDQQTYASLTPLDDETVGVGMPVIVTFDIPVENKAEFEKHMNVTAKPATVGSWSWLSDTEAHWRPKRYWESGTKVHVDIDVNSLNAGNGIYGQMDRSLDFKIGQSVIMEANLATNQMKVMVDGKLARTIPITGGKPGFETRSGTKLIIEKFEVKRMNAATVGISENDPEYYDIPDVQYAQRVTYSGEFIHAAPWSVYAQGSSNVSHGCVGISTDNGAWLYNLTHRGDPVEVTGTDRGLEQGNGWTDWDISYQDFKAGSALS